MFPPPLPPCSIQPSSESLLVSDDTASAVPWLETTPSTTTTEPHGDALREAARKRACMRPAGLSNRRGLARSCAHVHLPTDPLPAANGENALLPHASPPPPQAHNTSPL